MILNPGSLITIASAFNHHTSLLPSHCATQYKVYEMHKMERIPSRKLRSEKGILMHTKIHRLNSKVFYPKPWSWGVLD